MQDLTSIPGVVLTELKQSNSIEEVEELRIRYLGKSGIITSQLQGLGALSHEERKIKGQELNVLKTKVSELIQDKLGELKKADLDKKLQSESIDISLPSRERRAGSIHPISRALDEITSIFAGMGFSSEEGPEIEDEYHNFTALNIADNHPARDMHDTFYMNTKDDPKRLLRTHTSNVQIRFMNSKKPPFKFISSGRVYRCDSDATHAPMFHQLEGVYIDKNVDMGHLKGCLQQFLDSFFEGKKVQIRLRPSFFPFTEPSAEVDISINGSDWLEVLGCGMIHPNVLKNVNIDPQEYQGFAFGLGIDRFAMLKYGIKDLRTFFDGDLRWSKKFGFKFYE